MKISFYGADKSVTGSYYLIECVGKRILIDSGIYQGGRELAVENYQLFSFDLTAIDFVLLTHVHLDHCGRIPLLAKRGFTGKVITMAASVELARLVMLDSAGLQAEEAQYQAKKATRRILVHGEEDTMQIFAKKLHDTEVIIPELHKSYTLN
jgi:metallo-beta-lactamase family protein